jgi:hypothetical protein
VKIAFVADPLPSFNIKKDSTYAMMVEAALREHELYVLQQHDLVWKRNRVFGAMSQITLRKNGENWYALGPATEIALAELDCVLMRKPFDSIRDHPCCSSSPRGAGQRPARYDHSEKLAIAVHRIHRPAGCRSAVSCRVSSTSMPTWF